MVQTSLDDIDLATADELHGSLDLRAATYEAILRTDVPREPRATQRPSPAAPTTLSQRTTASRTPGPCSTRTPVVACTCEGFLTGGGRRVRRLGRRGPE